MGTPRGVGGRMSLKLSANAHDCSRQMQTDTHPHDASLQFLKDGAIAQRDKNLLRTGPTRTVHHLQPAHPSCNPSLNEASEAMTMAAQHLLPRLLLMMLLASGPGAHPGAQAAEVQLSTASKMTGGEHDPDVLLVSEMTGRTRAASQQDMQQLIKDNLDADFKPYQDQMGKAGSATMAKLLTFARSSARLRRSTVLIVVHKHKVTALTFPGFKPRFYTHTNTLLEHLQQHIAAGFQVPDTCLLLNTRDEPMCVKTKMMSQPCTDLPVFSHHKPWDWSTNSSAFRDVLLPLFSHFQEDLMWYPSESKWPVAFMRAGLHNQMNEDSCRYQLALMAGTPEATGKLDARIVSSAWEKETPFEMAPFVDIEAHAKWRYLVSCDGNSASARLGKLLAINSLVLKQRSPFIEWYYRSLVDGQHYVSFDTPDILKVIEQVQALSDDQYFAMVQAANEFAYQYLGAVSKTTYLTAAIERYNQLFAPGEMQRLLNSLPQGIFDGSGRLLDVIISLQGEVGADAA